MTIPEASGTTASLRRRTPGGLADAGFAGFLGLLEDVPRCTFNSAHT